MQRSFILTGLLHATALTALMVANAPATAQIGGRLRDRASDPGREILAAPISAEFIRLTGEWDSPIGRIMISKTGRTPLTAGEHRPELFGYIARRGEWQEFLVFQTKNGPFANTRFAYHQTPPAFHLKLLSDDSLELRMPAGQTLEGESVWIARRASPSTQSPLAGQWETSLGALHLKSEGEHLVGTVVPSSGGSDGRMTVAVHHFAPSGEPTRYLTGAWQAAVTGVAGAGAVRIDPSEDGTSFSGTYTRLVNGVARTEGWSGRRVATNPVPAETPPAPGPISSPMPAPAPAQGPAPAPSPVESAGFRSLRKFDVRVDRVVSARDAQRVDVFVTVKNASAQPQYIPSGTLQVMLEDSAGVAKQNGQVLRPTEAGREHFASTPVVAPGRELRVKYSFHPDTGTSPSRVTIMEGDKSADFPASF
jgi:hypothetical protein